MPSPSCGPRQKKDKVRIHSRYEAQIQNLHSSEAVSSRQQTTPGKVRVSSLPPQSTGGGVPTANHDPCQCSWLLPHTVNLFRSSVREHFPRGKSGCRTPRRVVTLEISAGVMAAVGLESTPLTLSQQIPISRPECLLHPEASPCLSREPRSRKTATS